MPVYTDQTGKAIHLSEIPSKIISLVPSQTELLHTLGLDKEVIGITKFCIQPKQWLAQKTKVGGTKNLNLSLIQQLSPDLIIANKEENTKEQIESLSGQFKVWISDISNLSEALQMIVQLGIITGKKENAEVLAATIQTRFNSIAIPGKRIKVAYLIWQRPLMTIGRDTFIHTMLEAAGFENVFSINLRYPEITIDELKEKKPELILLSSEPFPFTEKHVTEFTELIPGIKVCLVDGEMFSWYGSRLLESPAYFQQLRERLQ
ncbi:MAG: helical backbone metal receptor [Bacteroidota bacterium]